MSRYIPCAALPLLIWPAAAPTQAVDVDPAGQQQRMRVEGQVEKQYTIQLEAPKQKAYCNARIWTEYIQKNTMAAVKGEIENPDCGASRGEYTLALRYRDEHGEIHDVEHTAQWQRDDDRNVRFEGEYAIGEDTDLVRVRARKIVCVCIEPEETGTEN